MLHVESCTTLPQYAFMIPLGPLEIAPLFLRANRAELVPIHLSLIFFLLHYVALRNETLTFAYSEIRNVQSEAVLMILSADWSPVSVEKTLAHAQEIDCCNAKEMRFMINEFRHEKMLMSFSKWQDSESG